MIHYEQVLKKLQDAGRLRQLKPLSGRRGCRITYRDRDLLNLTSNDYLGFAGDEDLHRRFYNCLQTDDSFLDAFGLGAASSRLLTGDNNESHCLEQTLSDAYGYEASLLFNSGYHANIGILPALLTKNDLILSDKLNHASIMDGMRLSAAQHKRYRHCDYSHLVDLLKSNRDKYGRVIIVTESVFSMDGDTADLPRLVEIKDQYDCMLYVDEAHSIGLYGERGLGMAEAQGVLGKVDLLVGTFGKALSSVGAFLLCPEVIRSYLINCSRSLIFTTALPPLTVRWNHYLFKEMAGAMVKRKKLSKLSEMLRAEIRSQGLQTDGTTNIVPVMIGNDALTVQLAEDMQAAGYLIFPVRPPTVPENTSRFRLSLTADMEWADLDGLASTIGSFYRQRSGRL